MARAMSVVPAPAHRSEDDWLSPQLAAVVFAAFALSYFFSAVIRAATATLAPALVAEFTLSPADLGLLAGGYFLGFAAFQLPLGQWLDRFGPKRVLLGFMAVAVIGCAAFALAQGFASLLIARILTGIGVCACLMAPLTAYRRYLKPQFQVRANSWMLMSGSMGMVASTLPVAAIQSAIGWRGVFVVVGVAIVGVVAILAWVLPKWRVDAPPVGAASATDTSYRAIFKHPYFIRLAPLAFFNYGGMVAIQSLWAGPWMVNINGLSPKAAATGLFWINCCMLLAFALWGAFAPALTRAGWSANRLVSWGLPTSVVALVLAIALGPQASWPFWAAYCVLSTFVSVTQPAVAMAFPAHLTGRALSAYNLMIFAGVFAVQWGIGLIINAALAQGLGKLAAYQLAHGVFAAACALSLGWFWVRHSNSPQAQGAAAQP
jgi:predicted MFS family arabinose efflux permease